MDDFPFHNYPTTNCHLSVPVAQPKATLAALLSRRASRGQAALYSLPATLVRRSGAVFVLGETNSAACGGTGNVSDVLASALWVVDYLAEMSKVGVWVANFHGGPHGAYKPVGIAPGGGVVAAPLLYGLWLFSEAVAGEGVRWLHTTEKRHGAPLLGGNSAVHAALGRDRATNRTTLRLLLCAKETDEKIKHLPVSVSLQLDAKLLTTDDNATFAADMRVLHSPNGMLATTNITYAGQSIDIDGNRVGERGLESVSITRVAGSTVLTIGPIEMKPGSASLVVAQRANVESLY